MKWFHHDTDMHRNRKIRKLIRTHGATGYAFWCLLLEKLYEREDGFQINADELWFEDIAEDLKLGDYRTPIRILDTLADLYLIDKQLWQDHVISSPSIVKRGDGYVMKRSQETEKKRRYREKLKELSTVDGEGQKDKSGQCPQMSTADTDLDSDLDQNNKNQDLYAVSQAKMSRDDSVITQEKSLTKVESEEVAPTSQDLASSASAPEEVKKTKRSRPRKEKPVGLTAEDLNRVVEVYNANKPGCWSSVEILGTDRQRVLAKWLKDLGSIDGVIEAIEKALKSANDDDFWSGRSGKAHRLNFETLNDKGHLLTWAEAWNAAHPAKNQIQVVKNYPAGVTVENYQAWDELQVLAQRLGHKIEVLASREVFLIDGKTCHYGLLRMQLDDWRQKSLRKSA